jgi:hypothetical protein
LAHVRTDGGLHAPPEPVSSRPEWSHLPMQSKVIPGPFRRPAERGRPIDRALDAGLGFYLLLCCGLVGWFCFEFYQAMQPTRYPNLGISARELHSANETGDVPEFELTNKHEPDSAPRIASSSREPEVRTITEGASKPKMTSKIYHSDATADLKSKHAAQPRERDPMTAYGAQLFGNYRSGRSYQDPTWGSHQIPSGPQSRH